MKIIAGESSIGSIVKVHQNHSEDHSHNDDDSCVEYMEDESREEDWINNDKPITFKSDNVVTAIDKEKPNYMFREL